MQRVVVITGATSGYGLAMARKFHENGDRVIAVSRSAEKVERVVRENGFYAGYTMDVRCAQEWEGLCAFVREKAGRVDVLVNNAGGGVCIRDTVEQTAEQMQEAVALNLLSVLYGCRVFGRWMKEQGEGTVVNIASVCATHCWPGWSVYAAAKAGVLNFTKGFYTEMQPFGVRASCVIPAAAATGFQHSAGIGEEHQSLRPEDIAEAVFYVAGQPKGVWVEDMTVWGTSQAVQPL